MGDSRGLLEREAELAVADRVLVAAREGNGGLVVVAGPPGIGKTGLLAEFGRRGEVDGFAVLRGRGSELERDFSYGVVRQLFEPVVAVSSDEVFRGAASLASPVFELATAESGSVAEASYASLHGLLWLTANLGERRPLLLLVDDLHWADAPSLRFAGYLARRLEDFPVVLACALRTGEMGVDRAALAELVEDPFATVLKPAALGFESTAALIESALGAASEASFTAVVHDLSGGNPLFLKEMLAEARREKLVPRAASAAALRALAPESISARVLRRIEALGPEAVALAQSVAILGDGGALADAASLAGLSTESAAAAAAALRAADVLERRGPLGFAHPIVRAAVRSSLEEAERSRRHAGAAALLLESSASPEVIAVHLLQAPPGTLPAATETLREAARRALGAGAAESAVAYLRRALREPTSEALATELLFELGVAETLSDAPASAEHLRQAYERTPPGERLAETAIELARALYGMERLREAVEVLDDAIARSDSTDLVQWLEVEAISLSRFQPSLRGGAVARLRQARERVDVDARGGRHLLAILASEAVRSGTGAAEAAELARRALAGGSLVSEHTFTLAAQALVHADDFAGGIAVFDEAVAQARDRGSPLVFALASTLRSNAWFRRGELAEAEADARAARDLAEPLGIEGPARNATAFLVDVLIERGELDEAARLSETALNQELSTTYQSAWVLETRGRLRLVQGRPAAALTDLLRAGELLLALDAPNPAPVAWRSSAARAAFALGEVAQAQELAAEELERARQWGAASSLGRALRVAAVTSEDEEGRLALLREAVEVLEGSAAELERAYALSELGAALRRSNNRAQARGLLEAALDIAHRCGATVLTACAHEELLATGARPRRLARQGIDALTPSERRVAQMAAAGQSNREIAQALFVTLRTVETHLSNAYRKLGIRARSELGSALRAAA